jgi:adenine phosphoribosyltransferase
MADRPGGPSTRVSTGDWRARVKTIPDFPKAGVLFRDILPALVDGESLAALTTEMAERAQPLRPDLLVAPEARGFLLAGALAARLGVGVLPIRKAGKLPGPVLSEAYALEYGESQLEMETLDELAGRRALIIDDVLATGGTVAATARLLERAGLHVAGVLCVLELSDLGGRSRLPFPVVALWTM